jgi:hypothetical protein
MSDVNQTEIVHRPESGLARGVKEAPPAAFVGFLLVAVASLALYVGWHGRRLRGRRP